MRPSTQLGWLMWEAVRLTRIAVDEAVRSHGVTVSQWAVLYQIAQHPGLSGAELAREMLLTPQAVHQALMTLVRRGLVERTPDANHARIYRATLTDEGRRTASRCRADSIRLHRKLLATFEAEERAVFADLLQRYVQAMSTMSTIDR